MHIHVHCINVKLQWRGVGGGQGGHGNTDMWILYEINSCLNCYAFFPQILPYEQSRLLELIKTDNKVCMTLISKENASHGH